MNQSIDMCNKAVKTDCCLVLLLLQITAAVTAIIGDILEIVCWIIYRQKRSEKIKSEEKQKQAKKDLFYYFLWEYKDDKKFSYIFSETYELPVDIS